MLAMMEATKQACCTQARKRSRKPGSKWEKTARKGEITRLLATKQTNMQLSKRHESKQLGNQNAGKQILPMLEAKNALTQGNKNRTTN